MWELDYKASWALKNWCFGIVVLEKTLESPLDCKEIQPVHPKGDQSWVFIGGADVEAETPILWPPDVKSWFTGKDPDAGKDWRQEKGTTEDEMVGWHHRLKGHAAAAKLRLGVGDRLGDLAWCSPWRRKESEETEQLNWIDWFFPNMCNQNILRIDNQRNLNCQVFNKTVGWVHKIHKCQVREKVGGGARCSARWKDTKETEN